ncbi:hypothetical protein T440DRAFT_466520 [Plenodomus tracheiphilus IPT5]|uniref:Uncharacterized protein n=1 Tax=Plenodomus tracheiphilus IPT5 TaxID=1408161 RepID=A0A6A7BE24_9PLEO|nr:hypothetical protein T440DRAFT_466520 [Plenodomus tracheiphilus IPT5]
MNLTVSIFAIILAITMLTTPTLAKNAKEPHRCGGMGKCDKQGELRCEQAEDGRWTSRCDHGCRTFLAWGEDCDPIDQDANP